MIAYSVEEREMPGRGRTYAVVIPGHGALCNTTAEDVADWASRYGTSRGSVAGDGRAAAELQPCEPDGHGLLQ